MGTLPPGLKAWQAAHRKGASAKPVVKKPATKTTVKRTVKKRK